MKKIKECNKKKLSIKFPNMTLTARISDNLSLKKGDYIKLKIGVNLEMLGVLTSSQYEHGKNLDRIEVEEIESVDKSKIKEVFVI